MDESSFNLMRETWIPVTMVADGSQQEMSLLETILQSESIRSIDGDIPLQRFALTRLLIAVMYGLLPQGCSPEDWNDLFNRGPSDADVAEGIREYCGSVSHRFNLFDDDEPFYQVAGLHTAKHEVSGLERLVLDVPSGEPMFTTRIGEGLQSMSAAEAARWLVTTQACDVSGIKSGAVGDDRVKGGKGYPIGVAWCGHLGGLLVEGSNLWQTLMLNFVGESVLGNADSGMDWADDKPIWERAQPTQEASVGFEQDAESVAHTSYFHGPATLLTWQARRIRLAHQGNTVTGVLICNGDRLKPQNANPFEMMTAWRRSEAQQKALKRPLIYMPRKHNPDRALWRGLPNLTADQDTVRGGKESDYLRPYSLKWLTKVGKESMPVRLHAFGIEYGNQEAVVDSAVDDILDINLVVVTSDNPRMKQMLEQAVKVADQGVLALRNLASDIALAEGVPPDPIRQRAGEIGYTAFDRSFRRWVMNIHDDHHLDQLYGQWCAIAKQLLLRLGRDYLSHVSAQAIVGRKTVKLNPKSGEMQERYQSAPWADMRFRGALNSIFSDVVPEQTIGAKRISSDLEEE
ncbi:type I-E CRISPR-associated protein Cse1/CasA [Bifidobacterium psychraerophilum]|uniref:type I-E CRISPR-associated protein Cse1/CasA n=1 Tax=Bifidobacterium psychraerophilum TaxID=218140 RepID=UPI0039ED5FB2